jgi:Xaa-Pro aminopeptidase
MRAVGDGTAYLSDGRITNTRGQVVSEDVGTHVALARFLGFYPAIATQQNDIVRLSKYVSDYAKAIKADYTAAYVKARLAGDTDAMEQTLENVRNWNEAAAGTGLEINNFIRSANRAAREAARPTAMRFLKAAPKNVRPETLELLEIYGIEPGELQ